MTDPTPNTGAGEGTGVAREGGARTGMPRWVKVSLIVVGGLIALFVALQLAGVGGTHGPRRHIPSGGDATPSVSDAGHRPPPGMDHAP